MLAATILLYTLACFGSIVALILATAWVFCRDAPIGYARPIGYGYPIVAAGWNPASDHGLEPNGGKSIAATSIAPTRASGGNARTGGPAATTVWYTGSLRS